MTCLKTLILCAIILLAFGTRAQTFESIRYTLTPHIKDETVILKIRAEFKGHFDGAITFNFPALWNDFDYTTQIKNITLEHPEGIRRALYNQQIVTVLHTTSLVLSYEIHPTAETTLNLYKINLQKDFIHAPGYGLFCVPSCSKDALSLPITVEWSNLPESWNTLSSFGKNQTIHYLGLIKDFQHSFFSAGSIRITQFLDDQCNPIYLSLFGTFDMDDLALTLLLKGILSSQRSFFKETSIPFFAISLMESDDLNTLCTRPLTNSLIAHIPRLCPTLDTYITLAEGHLRQWIGEKIKNTYGKDTYKWFFDGFVSYFARVIALRTGTLTPETFVQSCNLILKNYYLSPLRKELEEERGTLFDEHRYEAILLSARGFVLSLYLDHMIQTTKPGYSLDDLVYFLYRNRASELSLSRLLTTAMIAFTPHNAFKEIHGYAYFNQTIRLRGIDKVLPLLKLQQGPFDLGFDFNELKKLSVIRKLIPQSNAYQQGIREGMKILGWEIFPYEPDEPAKLFTHSQTYAFKPESPEKRTVYCFKNVLDSQDRANILKFFSGK